MFEFSDVEVTIVFETNKKDNKLQAVDTMYVVVAANFTKYPKQHCIEQKYKIQ